MTAVQTASLGSTPKPSTAGALVEITGLSVGYRRHRSTRPALIGLDLSVAAGETVAIVGESGSGKTTIANAILGLLPANGRITEGSVLLDGVQTVGAKDKTLRRLRGAVVALVPQDPMVSLNPTQRIGSQIAEVIKLRGISGPQVERETHDFLTQAGILEANLRARQYPHELSGGLRQRVLIAIALAGRPKLIVADEPTSALDVTVQKRILDHLGELTRSQDISLLIITHDLAIAADRADRIIVMRNGYKVEEGVPGTVLRSPRQPYTRQLIAAAPGLGPDGRLVLGVDVRRLDVRGQDVPAPILSLRGVSKTFGVGDVRRGRRGFNALDDVSVAVARGRTHALVGESGCGKTTTLRIALGLETPSSGSVLLDGTEIAGLSWNKLRPLRRKAQLVHQDPFATLDPKFTIEQSITEPLISFKVGNRASRRARALELLDQVALPASFLDRLPAELSGGQRQRVAIARALSLKPDLLMLDEPVSALDVSVQAQILQLLAELQSRLGLSYLFVSHDLAVVAQISHTVSVMRAGRVIEEGPVAEVFAKPRNPYTQELIEAIPGRRHRTQHHSHAPIDRPRGA